MSQKNSPRVNALLHKERLLRGWSQQDLASHLGTTLVTVNRWERGIQNPGPLYRLKLCQIFEKSEEELGLGSQQETVPDYASSKMPDQQEVLVNVPDAQGNEMVLHGEAPEHEAHVALPLTKPTPSKRHLPFTRFLLLVFLSFTLLFASVVLFISWPAPLFSRSQALPTAPTVQPLASRQVLYKAQWSKDRGGWLASSHWHWSDQNGGMILTDSMTNSLMLAPYQVSTSSYAVEASIQYLSYTDLTGTAYGLVVGRTPEKGEVCGVGIHEKPEHLFIAQLARPTTQSQPIIAADVFRSPVTMNTQWHTYRVEVTPSHIRFFLDNTFVGQVTNDTSIRDGQVGIYVVGTLIAVKNFTVSALQIYL